MTRWCPVCESPGVPVANGDDSTSSRKTVIVSRDLPGISATHFCSHCPTFFRSQDRFYLTTQHGQRVHGIAVWPHRESHLSIEVGPEGLVATFRDGASVLIPRGDTRAISASFFRDYSEGEITTWARRRGFALRIAPKGHGTANLVVRPPGPHFVLLVTKAWFHSQRIRHVEDAMDHLTAIGVTPALFHPRRVPS